LGFGGESEVPMVERREIVVRKKMHEFFSVAFSSRKDKRSNEQCCSLGGWHSTRKDFREKIIFKKDMQAACSHSSKGQ
jgi:hypothetical protein